MLVIASIGLRNPLNHKRLTSAVSSALKTLQDVALWSFGRERRLCPRLRLKSRRPFFLVISGFELPAAFMAAVSIELDWSLK